MRNSWLYLKMQDEEDVILCDDEESRQLSSATSSVPEAATGTSGHTVEVLIGVGHTQCQNILEDAVMKLGVSLRPKLHEEILQDFLTISKCETKRSMMLQYSRVLQKPYSENCHNQESSAKRVIKHCGPVIINGQLRWKECKATTFKGLTKDDEKVLQYLAGATLRWGLRTFTGKDNLWCQNQISDDGHLAEEFELRNRGGRLIVPIERYFYMLKGVEYQFQKQLPCRMVDMRAILGSVDWNRYYPEEQHNIARLMVEKYIRGRAYIHCRAKSTSTAERKSLPSSRSLRTCLKSSGNSS